MWTCCKLAAPLDYVMPTTLEDYFGEEVDIMFQVPVFLSKPTFQNYNNLTPVYGTHH